MATQHRTFSGIFWSFIERFSVQGIQFILSFVIARQLMPSDYGLIAMLGIFMAIAQAFIDSGFSNALIQKQQRTEIDYSTVFYFNLIIAVLMYIIMVNSAHPIAHFYNQPQLISIIPWIGLNFIVSAMNTIPRTLLIIKLDFKKQAYISLISFTISGGIAVWMAYNKYGVWTLVFQNLLNNLINSVLLWIVSKWKPLWVFSATSFKELFSFGSKLLIGGILHTIYQNMYTLIIGRFFNATTLGYFNRASTLCLFPSINISIIISRVTYPIECELQNNEQKLQERFLFFIRTTAFIVFPLMIGLCVLAEPIVRLLLTEKWLGATPYIQIICFAYMWDPIMRMNTDLLNAKRKSNLTLKAEILKKITAFIILFLTIPYGVTIMCVGLIAYALVDMFIITRYTKKVLSKISLWIEIKEITPVFVNSIIMGITVYLCTTWLNSDFLKISLGICVGIIIYTTIAIITSDKSFNIVYSSIKKHF